MPSPLPLHQSTPTPEIFCTLLKVTKKPLSAMALTTCALEGFQQNQAHASLSMVWGLFRLGGQINFRFVYIHTHINTTFYVGITTKITKLRPKNPSLEACPSNATPSPPPPPPHPSLLVIIIFIMNNLTRRHCRTAKIIDQASGAAA